MSGARKIVDIKYITDAYVQNILQSIFEDIYIKKDEMAKGYLEMAEINLNMSEYCFAVESEVDKSIQQLIAESE